MLIFHSEHTYIYH